MYIDVYTMYIDVYVLVRWSGFQMHFPLATCPLNRVVDCTVTEWDGSGQNFHDGHGGFELSYSPALTEN
jgi:hypothetical protein